METNLQKNGRENVPHTPFYAPRVDVYENGEEYLIYADVPGIHPESLDVTYAHGELTIEAGDEGTPRRYRRAFTVPDGIDASGILAEVKEGILSVHLPKAPEVRPRRIQVNAA